MCNLQIYKFHGQVIFTQFTHLHKVCKSPSTYEMTYKFTRLQP